MNIIIDGEFLQSTDPSTLFVDEPIRFVDNCNDLTDLVVMLGLFPSKSQARKAGRVGPIPEGWNVIKGNKKTPLYIWNPTE